MLLVTNLSIIIFHMVLVAISTHSAIIPAITTMNDLELYPSHPNEVLPIQPILIYPKSRGLYFEGREDNDNVIYVKLLDRANYHPSKHINEDDIPPGRELTMKDFFYVKALANGQFSHRRLKVYRLPEFYAISIYHKGQGI